MRDYHFAALAARHRAAALINSGPKRTAHLARARVLSLLAR